MLSTLCKAQSPEIKVVKQYANGEYVLSIDGRLVTTLGADAVKAQEKIAIERDGYLKERDLLQQQLVLKDAIIGQKDAQIADLQKVAQNNDTQIKGLESLKESFRLFAAEQSRKIDETRQIAAEGAKKTWLDRLPVRFGLTLLSAGANGRTMFNPCPR